MKSRLESRNFKVSSGLGLEAMMSRLVSVGSVLVPALVGTFLTAANMTQSTGKRKRLIKIVATIRY